MVNAKFYVRRFGKVDNFLSTSKNFHASTAFFHVLSAPNPAYASPFYGVARSRTTILPGYIGRHMEGTAMLLLRARTAIQLRCTRSVLDS